MEEAVKNKTILILSVLCLVFFLISLGSCSSMLQYKRVKDKETASRFDLEEKVNKLIQEKTLYETKMNSVNEEVNKAKATADGAVKALQQEQMVSQSLKYDLDKVTKLNQKLEDDLKEALEQIMKMR